MSFYICVIFPGGDEWLEMGVLDGPSFKSESHAANNRPQSRPDLPCCLLQGIGRNLGRWGWKPCFYFLLVLLCFLDRGIKFLSSCHGPQGPAQCDGQFLFLGVEHVLVSVSHSAPPHRLLFTTTPSLFLCQGPHSCSTLAWDTLSPFPWLSGPSCLNFNLNWLERLSLILSQFCVLSPSNPSAPCLCIFANMYHFSVLYSTLNQIK